MTLVNTIAAEKEKRWPGGGLLLQQPHGWRLAFRSCRAAPAGCFSATPCGARSRWRSGGGRAAGCLFSNLTLALGVSFSTGGSTGLLFSIFVQSEFERRWGPARKSGAPPFAASGPWRFSGLLWNRIGTARLTGRGLRWMASEFLCMRHYVSGWSFPYAGGDVRTMAPLDDLGISSESCPIDDSVG